MEIIFRFALKAITFNMRLDRPRYKASESHMGILEIQDINLIVIHYRFTPRFFSPPAHLPPLTPVDLR